MIKIIFLTLNEVKICKLHREPAEIIIRRNGYYRLYHYENHLSEDTEPTIVKYFYYETQDTDH